MVDLNRIKNETKRKHAEKVLNGHESETYEELNLDYVNAFCARRNLKVTLQMLLFPDSTQTGLIKCSLCESAFRSRSGHPWFHGSARNKYAIKKQLIVNHLKNFHTPKEDQKRAREQVAAISASLTLDNNTILGGDILETFNNVLTERDDLLQILNENNVPAPSKGIPGMIIQAYLVLARLFEFDLLEPLSDREKPSNTEVTEQNDEIEIKVEPRSISDIEQEEEVFTGTVRFSESDDDDDDEDNDDYVDVEQINNDSDFTLSGDDDEFFAPSNKKRKKSTSNEKPRDAVQCPHCDKTVKHLNLHIKRIHKDADKGPSKARKTPKTPRTFPCPDCGDILKTKANLKYHIKLKHDDQAVTCDQCGKTVRNNESLKNHMRIAHAEKRFVCDICDFRTTHQFRLDLHRLKHFPDLMPFKCDYCPYATVEKRNLEAHVIKHTGEYPFQCDQCEFRCARKDHLQTHIISNHTEERPFKCDQCDKRFKFREKLNRHKKNHLGLKPYHCDMCDFKTAHKYNLQSHFKTIHLGIKNNQCHYCEKAFNRKGDLVKHMKQTHPNIEETVAQELSLQ